MAEAAYWKDRFEEATGSREVWQLVSKIRGKSSNLNIPGLKDENGNMTVSDQEKADLLNNFFANIGKNLAKNFSTTVMENDASFIYRVIPVCDEIKIDEKMLNHQIATLKPFKAMGVDKVPPRELKKKARQWYQECRLYSIKLLKAKQYPKIGRKLD